MFDDMRNIEDGTNVGRDFIVVGEKEVSTSAATGFGLAEVACIAVACKYHVAGIKGEYCFFLGGDTVENCFRIRHCIFSWIGRFLAIALIGHNNVASTARPKNKNFPHTCWMIFLPAASNNGAVELCVAYCVLAPYLIGALGNVWCCSVRAVCWKKLMPSQCIPALREILVIVRSPNRG